MLANRVREYTLTTGTGDITLAGAMAAHIRFSDAFAVGETVTYVIEDGDNYEIGTGTLLDATTLRRTAVGETLVDGVYDRSAPGAIALSGSARVYCAATAEFLLDPTEAADVIREVTLDAGVTVDGVLLKDGGANLTGDLVSGGAVGVGIAPAYTLDIENPDTNFYVGRWKRQGASLPGFLYSDTDGAGFTFGTNAFSGAGSKGGLYFGNNANIYLPENTGDLFIVDGSSRVRYAFRDDGVLTWNSGATGIEGSGYLSWATNKAIVSAKSGAFDLVLRGGGSDNLTLNSDGSSVFGGAVRFDAGAQALTVRPGASDHTYIGFSARSASPDTRSGYIGYPSAGGTAMVFNNELVGGQQFITNGVTWLNVSSSGVAEFSGNVRVAGSLQLNNNQALNWLDSGGSPRNGIVWDASNNLNLYSGQSNSIWLTGNADGSATFAGVIDARDGFFRDSAGGRVVLDDTSLADAATPIGFIQSVDGDLVFGQANRSGSGTTGSTTRLFWDNSANQWDFQGNILRGMTQLVRGISTSSLRLCGGTSFVSGANIVVHGEHLNDIEFRVDTSAKLTWDDSANHWNFQNNIVDNVHDLFARGEIATWGNSSDFVSGASRAFFDYVPGSNLARFGHLNGASGTQADLGFYSGGALKLLLDISEVAWNFQSNKLKGIAALHGDATSTALDIYSGPDTTGANIILYGSAHGVQPNDILFRTGATTQLQWDSSADQWNFQGKQITGLGNTTFSGGVLFRSSSNGSLTFSGGNDGGSGGNIVVYGQSHPTQPNDIELRSGTTVRLSWYDSANHWNFKGNDIVGAGGLTVEDIQIIAAAPTVHLMASTINQFESGRIRFGEETNRSFQGAYFHYDGLANVFNIGVNNVSGTSSANDVNAIRIARDNAYITMQTHVTMNSGALVQGNLSLSGHLIKNVDNSSVVLSGSNSPVLGGNIVLRGDNHPTVANDIEFRSNSNVRMQWDDSNNYWSFAGHQVTGVPLLSRGSTSSFLEMSGGDAASGSGANILLHGPSYPSFANDIQFRTGTTVRLSWDDSNSRWDCSSNPLFNVGNVFMGGSVLSKTSSSGSLTLTGGTGSSLGASIELFAQSHATRPNDFELRAGTTSVLRWDDGVSQLEIAQRMTVDTGGQSFTLLPGAADHAYMAFNARTASPTARSGYIGYASAATAGMSFVNELVGPQQFITNGITWLIGSSSGAATFFGNVINQSQMQLKSYMVANLPSASSPGAGSVIFVTDDAGGPVPAFSDGINFRRLTDRNIVSNSSAITELTISSGAITITKSFHAIDTESDASSDELDTINGGQDGDEITLVAEDDARSITLRHNIGNIRLSGSNNFTLSSLSDTITLIKRGANWLEKSRSNSS